MSRKISGNSLATLVGMRGMINLPIFGLQILLWFFVLSHIIADQGIWSIFIVWSILILVAGFLSLGLDKLLIETAVHNELLKWFATHGYGSQIGR